MLIRILLVIALSLPLAAQAILGEFTGTVSDPQAAAVTGARVTALEIATQRKWTAQTNERGIYRLSNLPSGAQYEVTVEAQGFKQSRTERLMLDVGEIKRVDFSLQIGAVSESVTVSEDSTALTLEKGELSTVVGERKITELPLNGRNIYQLAELQPGVIRVAGTGLQESETTDARVGASGTRFRDNNILMDGVTNNNDRQGGRTTITPNPDSIEQFKVVTNNLSAEFGRSGGALISVLTKAGSNDWHGSAFWFLRNDNLDASTTFEARRNSQPEFRRNQFGATLGGPVVKNHTFFFFSYQGIRQDRPSLTQYSVETPQFREFVTRTRPNSIAARLLRDFPPLANPVSNIRDVGSPAPGVRVFGAPDGILDLGDVFIPVNGSIKDNQYSVRIDQSLNGGRDTLTGRYTINDRKEVRPGDNSARAFTADFFEKDQNASLNYTHIFNPAMINELRLGWNYDPQITTGNFMEIPFVGFSVAGRSVSQYSQTFGNVFPLDFRLHTYQIYDAITITKGRHSLKIGGDLRWFQENSDFPTNQRPVFTFEDILDFADDEVLSLASRVDPNTGFPTGTYRNFRSTEFGLFLQDDWKVTPRLTLNLGVRYDNYGTLTEKSDKLSTLEFQSTSVVNAALKTRTELYNRDNNNFQPRFGFAWDPTGKANWSIRGGAGMFYSRVWSNLTGNSRFNPPFSLPVTLSALTPGQNPSAFYRIPYQGDPSFARPLDALGGSTALRPGLQTVDPTLVAPYTWQWFLSVQRRLPGQWVAEMSYLGNAGRKLLLRNEINRVSGDRADGLVDRVNRSFGSIVHGTNAISSMYHGLAMQATKRFSRNYTAQFAYTFSRSIDADSEPFGGGAGELQGVMEVSNVRLDRALSAFDANHRFTANFLWEMPFFSDSAGLKRALLGGWQWNGIVSLQSGFPFTVVTSDDYNLDGVFTDRPNAIKQLPRVIGIGPKSFLNGAFGPISGWGDLFRPAPAGTNGTLGRNTFRGPGFNSVDFSLLKSFRTPMFGREDAAWEFRAEAFNVFNRVNLRPPSNSLGAYSTASGRWSNVNFGLSTASFDARQIQLALRFRF
jgi:outer membrane receptor protein involved in Fe transport